MSNSLARLLTFACCGALASSCAPSKVGQCREAIALASAANSRAVALATSESPSGGTGARANNPEDLLTAAETLATAGDELRGLQLRDPQLQSWQDEYAATYSELAAATRAHVAAIEERDREAAEVTRDRLEAASAKEASLVQTINNYCLSEDR